MDFLKIRKCSFAQKGIYNSGEVGGSTECWWPSNVGKRQRLATQPGLADLFLAARNSGGLSFGCWILFGIFMHFRIE